MPFLIVVLRSMVKGIDIGRASPLHDGRSIEVGRDSERASGSPLAVRAVADAMHGRERVHCNGGLPAGTRCCHRRSFEREVAALRCLTFDMSGGPKGAKRPLERPLDGGVRFPGGDVCGYDVYPSALRYTPCVQTS